MGLQFTHDQAKAMGGALKEAAERIEAEEAAKTSPAPGCHRLHIPDWHPMKLNKLMGRHPMAIRKLKRVEAGRLASNADQQGIPRAHGPRRVHLVIHLGKGQRAGDGDAYWKVLLDGLVACGRLVDDTIGYAVLDPVEAVRGEMGTTIELADL